MTFVVILISEGRNVPIFAKELRDDIDDVNASDGGHKDEPEKLKNYKIIRFITTLKVVYNDTGGRYSELK